MTLRIHHIVQSVILDYCLIFHRINTRVRRAYPPHLARHVPGGIAVKPPHTELFLDSERSKGIDFSLMVFFVSNGFLKTVLDCRITPIFTQYIVPLKKVS